MASLPALGLISIVDNVAVTALKIVTYLDSIREGGMERRNLSDEITRLWMTLRNLQTRFEPLSAEESDAWMEPIESLAQPDGVLAQIGIVLDDVWSELTTKESAVGKVNQTLRWSLDNDYIATTIARVERLKTSIDLAERQASKALALELRDEKAVETISVGESQFKEIINWLSPCNFMQRQQNITATPGTGGWFFNSETFESWETGEDRWLWCYGIPGAGKTYLAANTVNELRRLHKSDDALILVAFCSFDVADSQSIDNLVASLLKQIVQLRMALPDKLESLYQHHYISETRPKLSDICDIIGSVLEKAPKAYIVLDALDELDDDSKRISLLDILYGLKGRPKIMVTSRKLESISNRFGYPVSGNFCDRCEKRFDYFWHCEDCPDYDNCEDCKKEGEKEGHVFVKRFSSRKFRIAAQPEDIENYIDRRIEVEDELYSLVDNRPTLRARIVEKIVEIAQDVFLLARFHMDLLRDCVTVGEILDTLLHLPQDINATYDQAMVRIGKLRANRQRGVKRLLMWVAYAERPLSIREIEHATAISRGTRDIQPEHVLSAKMLASLSAGMVVIDENEHVRLTHKTAETYFMDKRSQLFPDGDVEISECCLAYLQMTAFESGPCSGPDESDDFDARLEAYPLYGYASLYWGTHARRSKSEIVTPQALMFLRNRTLLEASIQALFYTDTESYDSWDVSGGVEPLHLVSFFGLNSIVSSLLSEGENVNVLDSLGTSALIYACARGYLDVTNTLLMSGASAIIVDGRGSTALHRCVKGQHVEITRRLLQEDNVAINALYTSWQDYTALCIACYFDNVELTNLLLGRNDIDPNFGPPTTRWNPLLLAAEIDHPACVEALLRHPRVDKNHQDTAGYTALNYAALSGHDAVVKILLNSGVNTELEDDQGGRPIQRAIDYDEFDVVKTLLDYPVEWNFRDTLGRTLLHSAAINDCSQVLRLLLETCRDIDIDAQGDGGETALHDAARCGYLDTVKVLLDFGARTDVLNKAGRTPVRDAKDAEHTEVLEVLRLAREKETQLDQRRDAHSLRKADTFASTTEIPLSMAVESQDLDTLQLRIARADPDELNAFSPDFKDTALHTACQRRGVEVVNMLLQAGVFVDPMDAFFRTPLTIACQKGDTDTVKSLVKFGADVNVTKFSDRNLWEIALDRGVRGSRTAVYLLALPQTEISNTSNSLSKALGWAAAYGNMEACKRLVDAGASVHLKNANGLTPAQIAKGWEQDEVEKYLFDIAAKTRTTSSPELLTLNTFTDNNESENIGHPPRRSPTSKQEFLQMIETGVLDDIEAADDLLTEFIPLGVKNFLWSPYLLAFVAGLLAILLACTLRLRASL